MQRKNIFTFSNPETDNRVLQPAGASAHLIVVSNSINFSRPTLFCIGLLVHSV